MNNPTLGFTLLFVENPLKSSRFYQEILNIKPVEESGTFVLFALKGSTMLGLWSKYTAEPNVQCSPGASEICFPISDVDDLYEKWQSCNVTVMQKPTDLDFGRTFVILDPDGHRIRIYKLHEEN
ncbi:MAG: Phenazine antibiotic resistance protein EhpR [Chlamydiia bacterium]|nr:Phenazine antibiotic resistance protein EhpR [Chlamydiia bacterium]